MTDKITCKECTELLKYDRVLGEATCKKHGRYHYSKRYRINKCPHCAKETKLCANCGRVIEL
jgi:hypothetical protein